jgi:Zn-dependent alcohol dehydrogenase
MRTTAALLRQQPGSWDVGEVELDDPRDHEVRVRMAASGLCHSDDHFATGDISVGHLPFCGGHEGAGVVEAVGPGVSTVAVGDHIVTSFIPSCGRCQGSLYGMMSPAKDVPRLLGLWRTGALRLDELITRTYSLAEINQGYADLHTGEIIRGLVRFDA